MGSIWQVIGVRLLASHQSYEVFCVLLGDCWFCVAIEGTLEKHKKTKFIKLTGSREEFTICHMGHRGRARFLSGGKRQERGESIRPEPLLGFLWDRYGRGNNLGLTSLNYFGGL